MNLSDYIRFSEQVFILLLAKYVIIFGGAYIFLWKIFPKLFFHLKIQQITKRPAAHGIEIKYFLFMIIIQSLFLTFLFMGSQQGLFSLHAGFGTHGYASEIIGFIGYFLLCDTYFYWTHRWMREKWLYQQAPQIHHRSMNPTSLASFSFHPIETVINLFYMLPVVYFFSVSYELFVVLLILTDIGNLTGHIGYEFIPEKFYQSYFGRWITTPTHHNMHHQVSKSNFGLYWVGWDKIFKTLHPGTKDKFHRIKNQKAFSSNLP